jgi:S1-C subfamily serine protease
VALGPVADGEYDRAISDLTKAIQLDPKDPNPYLLRGRSYAKKGEHDSAIADLTSSINFPHPRLDFAFLVRGDAYETHGDLKEALSDYNKSAALSSDPRLAREAENDSKRVQSKLARVAADSKAEDPKAIKLRSAASGFVINNRGFVLTNHHVVEGCLKVRAGASASMHEATVFASDENNDLAVLRLTTNELSALQFREGRGVRQADQIITIGYPLSGVGLLSTSANVSTGTVSALAGPNDDSRWLQISAPTQPNNSGGPIIDMSGNVVGVVVANLKAAALL